MQSEERRRAGPAVDILARTTLAGGRGTRLGALTDWRAKPSLPFGGKFRITDFTLSSCVNSGIRHIGKRKRALPGRVAKRHAVS